MWKDTNALTGSTRRRRLVIIAVASGLIAFLLSYAFAVLDINGKLRTGLVSDVNAYRDIADSVLDGAVPYLDFPLEHLPSMLIPIVGLGWLSGISGVSLFLVWPMAMTSMFAATALLVDRFDPQRPAGFIFVAISLPLLPLALFRLEPWVVLIAAAAIVSFLSARNALGVGLTVLGSIAKAWPIVAAILPWKSGHRLVASLAVIGSGFALVTIFMQGGFRAGRDFDGIHTETVLGSFMLVGRHLSGTPLDTLASAGARYVTVPSWAVFVNAIPGLVVFGVIAMLLWRPISTRTSISVIGLSALGIILVSPLFSTQFLVWLAPFAAALSFRNRMLYVTASVFAFASVAIFDHTSFVWAIEVAVSNVLVLALATAWSWDLIVEVRTVQPASTSLKNLPV